MATKRRKRSRDRSERLSSSAYREAVLTRAAETLLGCEVRGVEYPGGRSRESYRLLPSGGEPFIATRRRDIARARQEGLTLRALNRHGVRVPELLGTNHAHVILQQEILGTRLSRALTDAEDRADPGALLAAALDSLVAIQRAATDEGLEGQVATLGGERHWVRALIERPAVIGRHLEVAAPALDTERLVERLQVTEPRFVKWDARPGNALVTPGGEVYWFDWEHAGKRNRLDDMAWLLGDEFVPDDADAERALLARFVPAFAAPCGATGRVEETGEASPSGALDYLMTYGTFHMVVRLGLILKHMKGEWWELDRCIAEDKVGVTLGCARRLCRRGARWSAASELAAPLADWFRAIEPRIEAL